MLGTRSMLCTCLGLDDAVDSRQDQALLPSLTFMEAITSAVVASGGYDSLVIYWMAASASMLAAFC